MKVLEDKMNSFKKLLLNILLFINLALASFGVLYSVINIWSAEVIIRGKLDISTDEKLAQAYGSIVQSRNILIFIGIVVLLLTFAGFALLNVKSKKAKELTKTSPKLDGETDQKKTEE